MTDRRGRCVLTGLYPPRHTGRNNNISSLPESASTTARSVFTSLRRRAPDWTNQGVKLIPMVVGFG